eukprot:scaffold448865_cov51-Prasinocladus_malaysianus.AAC.1
MHLASAQLLQRAPRVCPRRLGRILPPLVQHLRHLPTTFKPASEICSNAWSEGTDMIKIGIEGRAEFCTARL